MPDSAKFGDYVQIHEIVLNPDERSPHVPDDTKKVPLELWVKGFIQCDANLGDIVEIQTVTGRKAVGELVDISPSYPHDFGEFVPELIHIGIQLRQILNDAGSFASQSVSQLENKTGADESTAYKDTSGLCREVK